MTDAEFLLGLFEHGETPAVTQEDFDGPHGGSLRQWQGLGVVSREASHFHAASCPHCGEGVPHLLGGRYLCNVCRSGVDPRYLLLWTVDLRAFLEHVAVCVRISGGVRPIDDVLWQIGTGAAYGEPVECFYRRRGTMSGDGQRRLAAYRRLIVFHGPATAPDKGSPAQWVPLVELFDPDGMLAAPDLADLLRTRGKVRFDARTGALRVGDVCVGEVPLWSREFFFLACLHDHLDHYVPYADLKREILRSTGGGGDIDEATLCQKLKSRIKSKYIPGIDRLIVTSNKGDGYRLRAEGDA